MHMNIKPGFIGTLQSDTYFVKHSSIMRREALRDCQAWLEEGLPLSTTSNEAANLYDSCLSQYVGWYDDDLFGGLEKTCDRLVEADNSFALGRAFVFGLQLLGTNDTIKNNTALKEEYNSIQKLTSAGQLNTREQLHIKAILHWAEGNQSIACATWEDILVQFPTDIHALKMAHDTYFYLGDLPQIRDSVGRVLPVWERKKPPLKSYLYGMYAFGLEENNHFTKAEYYARKGLEENRRDGWSTHSLVHVFEMGGRTREGIKFMQDTIQDWESCNLLSCHNHWHTALYHFENEDHDNAAEILQTQILSRASATKSTLDFVDCASLMWRLKMFSPNSLKKMQGLNATALCRSFNKRVTTFNDAHFMMGICASKDDSTDQDKLELLDAYSSVEATIQEDTVDPFLGKTLLKAVVEFEGERYANAVDLLEPIRFKLTPLGGSNAQRDVFSLMLIVSALKSSNGRHRKLGQALMNERKAMKETLLTERLLNLAK